MLCKVSTEVDCDTLRREVSYDRQILEPRLIDRVKGAESRATQKRRRGPEGSKARRQDTLWVGHAISAKAKPVWRGYIKTYIILRDLQISRAGNVGLSVVTLPDSRKRVDRDLGCLEEDDAAVSLYRQASNTPGRY